MGFPARPPSSTKKGDKTRRFCTRYKKQVHKNEHMVKWGVHPHQPLLSFHILSLQDVTSKSFEFHLIVDAMGSSSSPKLSGMQKQVLSLYRAFLRAARVKAPEERRRIEAIVSEEFRHNSKLVDRKNFVYIEYLLRRGRKQLDQLKSPQTIGLSAFKFDPSES